VIFHAQFRLFSRYKWQYIAPHNKVKQSFAAHHGIFVRLLI